MRYGSAVVALGYNRSVAESNRVEPQCSAAAASTDGAMGPDPSGHLDREPTLTVRHRTEAKVWNALSIRFDADGRRPNGLCAKARPQCHDGSRFGGVN